MKQYPKQFEDPFRRPKEEYIQEIDSPLGSAAVLADRFGKFYKHANKQIFDIVVQQIWLESKFNLGGNRHKRRGNGHYQDRVFGYFMKGIVGFNQKAITGNFYFTALSSYIKDFFPDFLNHDPLEDPEYYKFPYENLNICHMMFVHHMHNRLELLEHANQRSMNLLDFMNWVTNYAMCYNLDVGKDVYGITNYNYLWPFIKKLIPDYVHQA